jgi:hypothetical protein
MAWLQSLSTYMNMPAEDPYAAPVPPALRTAGAQQQVHFDEDRAKPSSPNRTPTEFFAQVRYTQPARVSVCVV